MGTHSKGHLIKWAMKFLGEFSAKSTFLHEATVFDIYIFYFIY